MLTTRQIAGLLGVQHELVRDAAGPLRPSFTDHDGRTVYSEEQQQQIRQQLAQWGRLCESCGG